MNIKESFSVHGENLLKKTKELIAEGNIRRITITEKSGKELMSFPLYFGVVGVLVAPVLAAVGALAGLIGECTITVERDLVKEAQRKEEEKEEQDGGHHEKINTEISEVKE